MFLPSHPRIAIVGAGSLGGYVGARLARAGQDVHFLARGDFEHLRRDGWNIDSTGEPEMRVKPVRVYRSTAEIGAVDLVIIGLKTTQGEALRELVPPLLRPSTVLLTIQNGMGVTEALKERFPEQAIVAGLCYIAATREGPGQIVNRAPHGGRIRLAVGHGAAGEAVPQMAQILESAGIQCDVLASLEEAIWRKLMWNVPFNGLPVALGGTGSDAVVDDPDLTEVARALMEELRAAAAARGCPIEPEFTSQLIEYTRQLGAYQASTVVDFLAGRSLEVESIWGVPLERGRAAGVAMPHLATLHAILKGIDLARRRS